MAVSRPLLQLWWSEMVWCEFVCVMRKNVRFNTVSMTGKQKFKLVFCFINYDAQIAAHSASATVPTNYVQFRVYRCVCAGIGCQSAVMTVMAMKKCYV
jgi:hypothetical protein